MKPKKEFKVYYLVISEGTTESNIFAYITTRRYRDLFERSNIKFSDKADYIDSDGVQVVSRGVLHGVGSARDFKVRYSSIKRHYKNEKLFFVLDKDLDDSAQIGEMVVGGGDCVQWMEFNSEYVLLKLGGKNPKDPSEFKSLNEFRRYTESEFLKQFKKKASTFSGSNDELDLIFNSAHESDIRAMFAELFATVTAGA